MRQFTILNKYYSDSIKYIKMKTLVLLLLSFAGKRFFLQEYVLQKTDVYLSSHGVFENDFFSWMLFYFPKHLPIVGVEVK